MKVAAYAAAESAGGESAGEADGLGEPAAETWLEGSGRDADPALEPAAARSRQTAPRFNAESAR